jgi:hypothetical protein
MSKVVSFVPERDLSAFDKIVSKYQPADVLEVVEQIGLLAAGFPQGSKPAETVENTVKAYCIALELFPLEPISWAVMAFLKGQVDGQNTKFMPTSADLTKEARRQLFLWDFKQKKAGESNG